LAAGCVATWSPGSVKRAVKRDGGPSQPRSVGPEARPGELDGHGDGVQSVRDAVAVDAPNVGLRDVRGDDGSAAGAEPTVDVAVERLADPGGVHLAPEIVEHREASA